MTAGATPSNEVADLHGVRDQLDRGRPATDRPADVPVATVSTTAETRDQGLAEYLDAMDQAGGGIYTADFRDGFRHALAMLTAFESDAAPDQVRPEVREAARLALSRRPAPEPSARAGLSQDERAVIVRAVDAIKCGYGTVADLLTDAERILADRLAVAEQTLNETRDAYERWKSEGRAMHRALLDLWRSGGDREHMTFGGGAEAAQVVTEALARLDAAGQEAAMLRAQVAAVEERSRAVMSELVELLDGIEAWATELAASAPEAHGHIASMERRQFAAELRRRFDVPEGGKDG
ncbi:hypothetical protein ABFU82_22445 [Nocardioides sp. WV_118_6]